MNCSCDWSWNDLIFGIVTVVMHTCENWEQNLIELFWLWANPFKQCRGNSQSNRLHSNIGWEKVQDYLWDDWCVLFHVVREFAHHGDDELSQRWDQIFDVFIPVACLQDWLQKLFVQLIYLIRTRNKKSINLKCISHKIGFIWTYNEIEWLTQILLEASKFLSVISQIFQSKSCRLKENINIIWTLIIFIFGCIRDEFGQNLWKLLTVSFNLSFGDLYDSI